MSTVINQGYMSTVINQGSYKNMILNGVLKIGPRLHERTYFLSNFGSLSI